MWLFVAMRVKKDKKVILRILTSIVHKKYGVIIDLGN